MQSRKGGLNHDVEHFVSVCTRIALPIPGVVFLKALPEKDEPQVPIILGMCHLHVHSRNRSAGSCFFADSTKHVESLIACYTRSRLLAPEFSEFWCLFLNIPIILLAVMPMARGSEKLIPILRWRRESIPHHKRIEPNRLIFPRCQRTTSAKKTCCRRFPQNLTQQWFMLSPLSKSYTKGRLISNLLLNP